MSALGFLALVPACVLAMCWARAWAILTLVGWFIVPTYAVPVPPTYAVAGILLLVGLVTKSEGEKITDTAQLLGRTSSSLLSSVLAVGLGAIVRWIA